MKLNLDVVPSTLDEAVKILKEAIETEEERESLSDALGHHFGFGMYLRNNWSLWNRETVLVQWFKKNLGIAHADDISSTILESLAASIQGKDFDAKEHADRYIKYWKSMNIDPLEDA